MKALKFFAVIGTFLFPMALALAQGSGPSGPVGDTNKFPNPFKDISATGSIYDFILFIFDKIILPIGAVVVVFYIIYTGYLFVTANGVPEKIETARHSFLYAVIGAAILLGAWTIAGAIKGTLCEISGNNIPGLCNTSIPSGGSGSSPF